MQTDERSADPQFKRLLGETREVFLARVLLSLLERLCAQKPDAWTLMLYDALKHDVESALRPDARQRPGGRD